MDKNALNMLKKWAEYHGATKQAFVDPAGMQGGQPPISGTPQGEAIMAQGAGQPPMDPAAMGGQPPMDPAAMQGGQPQVDPQTGLPIDPATGLLVDPQSGMLIDPQTGTMIDPQTGQPVDPAAMQGGQPPMDPAAMQGGMPPDPSTAAMGDQEAMRSIIREEIQNAMGAGGGGEQAGTPKKANKIEEQFSALKEQMAEERKILIAALRRAGVDIPLADLYGLEAAPSEQPGASEELATGMVGTADGALSGKVAAFDADVDALVKLANARDYLKRSAIGGKIVPARGFDPRLPDNNYLAGLYR